VLFLVLHHAVSIVGARLGAVLVAEGDAHGTAVHPYRGLGDRNIPGEAKVERTLCAGANPGSHQEEEDEERFHGKRWFNPGSECSWACRLASAAKARGL